MNRSASMVVLAGITAALAAGEDITFRKSRIFDSRGKQHKVGLVFQDTNKAMAVREKTSLLRQVPYDRVDKIAYGYSKRRRLKEGLTTITTPLGCDFVGCLAAPVFWGVGTATLFTKEKKHWLYVEYKDQAGASRELVLWLDKSEYHNVLTTLTSKTGKDVETLPEDR